MPAGTTVKAKAGHHLRMVQVTNHLAAGNMTTVESATDDFTLHVTVELVKYGQVVVVLGRVKLIDELVPALLFESELAGLAPRRCDKRAVIKYANLVARACEGTLIESGCLGGLVIVIAS
jgi:hypothetical protein